MKRWLCAIWILAGLDVCLGKEAEEKLNFDAKWPDRVRFDGDPRIEVIKEDATERSFIYVSDHYRYASDVRLSMSVVKGFAVMFEATHAYCRELPLALDGGDLTDGKLLIRLYEHEEGYHRAGGPPGSAGVFIPRRKCVMVPLTSLGVRKVGSGYMFDRDKCNTTLTHELTHQLTPEWYFQPGALGWFSEGLAEYVACTPYRAGVFQIRGNRRDVVKYVTDYGNKGRGGMALGDEVVLPPLEKFWSMPYSDFTAGGSRTYGGGLLLTYYFAHMDGKEDAARLKDFLKKLREEKDGNDALMPLLDGRTVAELQEQISKEWKKRGIGIVFAE